MSEGEKVLQDVLREIYEIFKPEASQAKKDIEEWAKLLLLLKKSRAAGTEKQIKDYELAEKYAWLAVQAIKTKYTLILENRSWIIIEKLLSIARNVFLKGLL